MKTLLKEYQEKLNALEDLIIKNKNNGSINDEKKKIRLLTMSSVYQEIISDIKRAIESKKPENNSDEILISRISDIISSEVTLREVPYSMSDNEMETNPDSITDAAVKILELIKNG